METNSILHSAGAACQQQACSAWVALSDRLPTAEDGDIWGGLWMWYPEHAKHGSQIGNIESLVGATHWQRITKDNVFQRPKSPHSEPNEKALSREGAAETNDETTDS